MIEQERDSGIVNWERVRVSHDLKGKTVTLNKHCRLGLGCSASSTSVPPWTICLQRCIQRYQVLHFFFYLFFWKVVWLMSTKCFRGTRVMSLKCPAGVATQSACERWQVPCSKSTHCSVNSAHKHEPCLTWKRTPCWLNHFSFWAVLRFFRAWN